MIVLINGALFLNFGKVLSQCRNTLGELDGCDCEQLWLQIFYMFIECSDNLVILERNEGMRLSNLDISNFQILKGVMKFYIFIFA